MPRLEAHDRLGDRASATTRAFGEELVGRRLRGRVLPVCWRGQERVPPSRRADAITLPARGRLMLRGLERDAEGLSMAG